MNEELLLSVSEIALCAGTKIMEFYGDRHFSLKEDQSPVTQADIVASEYICRALKDITPYATSSEENALSYEERKNLECFWLIDPLDGTKGFIECSHGFSVNIALIVHNQPTLGVVYAPALQQFYCGLKNYGAFCITENLQEVSSTNLKSYWQKMDGESKCPTRTPLACDSAHHSSEQTRAFIKRYQLQSVIRDSSLKICALANGEADLYPRFCGTKEWDTAAADIILQETGGIILDIHTKQPLCYNKKNVKNPYFVAFSRGQVGGWIYNDFIKNNWD
ncbi:hypothetical protein CCZ01_07075 [Helicobacter monodelphidis]|uniref:3'(2'),5'-bisphosphate nucleotidase CysQ family protein n=1 Tax=Helicobacter sp. 15-1451 TaxID=2004995 RepID=UPI000DCE04B6|nr:3'(2'),5'-bisphosphate nucleotidase CysQ [Helicobacter sp. 15-1451]RAX57099.1 hypothetical protein CCZ01_07075 [Helicobacter sp. 15-1451]